MILATPPGAAWPAEWASGVSSPALLGHLFPRDLPAGIESLNINPETEEDSTVIFEFKRGIIKTLVNRVMIDKRRELKVVLRLNVL